MFAWRPAASPAAAARTVPERLAATAGVRRTADWPACAAGSPGSAGDSRTEDSDAWAIRALAPPPDSRLADQSAKHARSFGRFGRTARHSQPHAIGQARIPVDV